MTIKTAKLKKNWFLLDLTGRVVKGIGTDNCIGHAAEIAFFLLFALFPILLSLTSLLAYLPVPDLVQVLLRIMGHFLPDTVLSLVEKNLQVLVSVQKGGLLTLGVLLAFWSASKALFGFQTAMNAAYTTKDQRPFWQMLILSLLLIFSLLFFMIASLLLLLFGPRIGVGIASMAGLGQAFSLAWVLLRWPLIFALMITALSALYRYAPALKLTWRQTIPGAVMATAAWVVLSLGFSYYVNNFSSYDKTYGSIGAVIALLFWMHASAFVILVGGEINARLREVQKERTPGGKAEGEM